VKKTARSITGIEKKQRASHDKKQRGDKKRRDLLKLAAEKSKHKEPAAKHKDAVKRKESGKRSRRKAKATPLIANATTLQDAGGQRKRHAPAPDPLGDAIGSTLVVCSLAVLAVLCLWRGIGLCQRRKPQIVVNASPLLGPSAGSDAGSEPPSPLK